MSFSIPDIDALTHQPLARGGVMALGNFDGVHLGHRAVLQSAAALARQYGCSARALTFEPHPYTLFQKKKAPFVLTSTTAKKREMKAAGMDDVVTLPFTPAFAALTPEAFVREVLLARCGVEHVVVGFDFVFGSGRGGDRSVLRSILEPRGIGVTEVPPLRDAGGEIISSSRIRDALRAGDAALANSLLGRPFAMEGVVQKGDQRGRLLGFPTANMGLGAYVRPRFGVYAVKARPLKGGALLNGVANIGRRPTIDGVQVELLETHLFDFEGDLYGQFWVVELHGFIRPEEKFLSLGALKEQMALDARKAREMLSV